MASLTEFADYVRAARTTIPSQREDFDNAGGFLVPPAFVRLMQYWVDRHNHANRWVMRFGRFVNDLLVAIGLPVGDCPGWYPDDWVWAIDKMLYDRRAGAIPCPF